MVLSIDCKNIETATKSLCLLFGVAQRDLDELLERIDLDGIYSHNEPLESADEFLYSRVTEEIGTPKMPIEVNWFHLTRTTRGNDFRDGILPLSNALETLWGTVLHVFKGTIHHDRLMKMHEAEVPDHHYQNKTQNSFHWGPYAMLVKEVAFYPDELAYHDYLWLPEILEDICNGYSSVYGISLHEILKEALLPCIVKFKSRKNIGTGCLKSALLYMYYRRIGRRISDFANTCFDGRGIAIPYSDILKVEFIEKT